MADTAEKVSTLATEAGQPTFFELSRLMVVAIDNNNMLNQKAQTKPNGPWDANWTAIDSANRYSTMATGLTRDGRVAVIGQATGGGVLYIDEKADGIGAEQWNAPVNLGSPVTAGAMGSLSMARDSDGRIEIFGVSVGSNGSIWWIYQNPDQIVQKQETITPPGTSTPIVVTVDVLVPPATPWSAWIQIPGGLVSITAIRQGDGRVALVGINSAGNLYRCVQSKAVALTAADWTQWVMINDGGTGTIALAVPVVGPLGALHIFAVSQGGQVVHTLQRPAATENWTPWFSPGYSRAGIASLAASLDGDGHLFLAATDKTKVHCFNSQTDPAQLCWTGWRDFSSTGYPVQIALDYNSDGRLSFFSHWLLPQGQGLGGLWVLSQAVIDSTEWEYEYTMLAPSNILQFSVVRDLTPPAG